jgi:transposase
MRQKSQKAQVAFKQKAIIVGMSKAGMKPKKISQQTGIGQTTVSAIIARSLARGTVARQPGSGKQPKTSETDLHLLGRILKENPRMKMAEV